jgi:hypothetical protein
MLYYCSWTVLDYVCFFIPLALQNCHRCCLETEGPVGYLLQAMYSWQGSLKLFCGAWQLRWRAYQAFSKKHSISEWSTIAVM